jgi:hypothetical protein
LNYTQEPSENKAQTNIPVTKPVAMELISNVPIYSDNRIQHSADKCEVGNPDKPYPALLELPEVCDQ